jgi:TonB family protein
MFIAYLAAASTTVPTASAIDPASWFGANAYPAEAWKKGIEGSVTFDVDVSPEGKPTACRVVVSSGYQVLDQATCDAVQAKGRFVPATGQDGRPVPGHYSNRTIWRIPNLPQAWTRAPAEPIAGSHLQVAAPTAIAPVPSMTSDWWSDYYDTPAQGVAPGEASLVVAEITVNKFGGFAGCVGHTYVGNPQMGPYVCSRLEKRAVFDPARGPDGVKVIGVYRKLIVVANFKTDAHFRAPNFGIHIPGAGETASDNPFEIQFYLDAQGQVSDCSLIDSVGINLERHKQIVDPALVRRACGEVPIQLKPLPPTDKHGNPVPTTQNALVIIDRPVDPHNQ